MGWKDALFTGMLTGYAIMLGVVIGLILAKRYPYKGSRRDGSDRSP